MDIPTGDAVLRCETHGDTGPLVICAHGFADCGRSFREQIDALRADGHRVAIPTMRGYNPSTVSKSGRYDAYALGEDLVAVADALSPDAPVKLLGHDWGAVAAYAACQLAPKRISHVVTAAVPHVRVTGARFAKPAQLRRSWYMGLFQLPIIAERKLRADDMALIERLWRDWSPGYSCPPDEMQHIKDAIAPNIGAVLGYYRELKNPLGRSRDLLFAKTDVSAMYLHGQDDGCIGAELCHGLESGYSRGVEVHMVANAGHFLHLEQPDDVNALLRRFFAS